MDAAKRAIISLTLGATLLVGTTPLMRPHDTHPAWGIQALLDRVGTEKAEALTRWSKLYQASCYGPYEGETVTATGKRIMSTTRFIAVPISRIVSKSRWLHMSHDQQRWFYFYGESFRLKHGRHTCKVSVQDCGGFAGCGTYHDGKWVPRMFDLTPAVFHALHINGTGLVRVER